MNVLNLFDVEIFCVAYQDQVWYLAKDVCIAFGLKNTSQSVTTHVKPSNAVLLDHSCPTGQALFITADGVYDLLTSANSQEIKVYRKKFIDLLVSENND